jgi:nucleoside-diphosphate-sugar epimerase
MTTLVTGANGFVGLALGARLRKDGTSVRSAVRTLGSNAASVDLVEIGDLDAATDWADALVHVSHVVHLAARVHVMNDTGADQLAKFRRVNVEGTANLAHQAAAAGVRRFVYLSSIKVNGEFTERGRPFTADDAPAPEDPYGVSKHETEQLLRRLAAETEMEVVIIRPPLVYGPRVKANFEALMRWLARDRPLPLAAATGNRRSFVGLDNLVDLIVTCLNHPAAANQTFLASDDEDLSTVDLLQRLGDALGHPSRLFYMPPALLKVGAKVVGQSGAYQRLCGSLQLDIAKTRKLLGWAPPVSVDDGLRRAAKGFCA